MNEELWKKLDKLRGLPSSGADGLAEFFRQEGIRFAPTDLDTWSRFIAARLGGKMGGTFFLPSWLGAVMVKLAEAARPRSVCDPWAGFGFLVATLREACKPEAAVALTQSQAEHALGSVLVPDVEWSLGEPLGWLEASNSAFDLVASILPMHARAARPLRVSGATGADLELADELGNLLMVAGSLHLTATGVGLFVVPRSFFFSRTSVLRRFDEIGLGLQAALALPAGTFAPYTSIPAYLLIVRRGPLERMFVAQLSSDEKANNQVLQNLRDERESSTPEMGCFVDPSSFTSLEALRAVARFEEAERSFGTPASRLADLATAINLGRTGADFTFAVHDNALFIPLIGNSEVVASADDLKLKKQNYAQVVIDPARSSAQFVARFLNSDFGIEIRERGKTAAVIPRLSKQTLAGLSIFVPELKVQRVLLDLEARIAGEQNTLLGLQNELAGYRREIWRTPAASASVERGLNELSRRFSGGLREHAAERLDQWFETLPFPLASILRAWQATPSQDFRTKYEHLLHFFEATAEFASVVLLSAFSSNEALFAPHRQRILETMQKHNLSFQRATFGAWKLVVEYLGKQTRELLTAKGDGPIPHEDGRDLCAQMFADPSLCLAEALSRKEFAQILAVTNKMRNDWLGHAGVVSAQDAQLRNEQLLAEVQKLREAQADVWERAQLMCGLYCRPRGGLFENEVAVLRGSNSEFLKEKRNLATWLDIDALYLWTAGSTQALRLMPLVRIGASPQSAMNACYFFSRLDGDGARFVSYHFADMPELTGQFGDATDAINRLMRP